MDKRNNFITCHFCQKVIINRKIKISNHYKPAYCVIERETKKDKDGVFSNPAENIYHYRCYKKKSWDEEDKLVDEMDKLFGVVHC